VRITVLGKSPAWQDAGGACSGYLVEEDDCRLLLDCGNGVFGKLRAHGDFTAVDDVVISHLHADHFLDLVPYAYALAYSPHAGKGVRPTLFVPPGGRETLRRVTGAWDAETLIEDAFFLHEYDTAVELELGPLRIRFREVPHFIRTHAVQVRTEAASFTYGADCGPNDALVDFARGTDLLLLEATLEQPEPEQQHRGHLTPAEAGAHARRAGARRLVLTHISDELDGARACAEAADAFGGPVELAHEGAVYEL
jgi:ribonuclease BN (tRNA processing enzyme)